MQNNVFQQHAQMNGIGGGVSTPTFGVSTGGDQQGCLTPTFDSQMNGSGTFATRIGFDGNLIHSPRKPSSSNSLQQDNVSTTSSEIELQMQLQQLEQLQAQASGYEKVLAREPDNINALSALIQIRLQTGDLEGAIAPLGKLIEIYPEDPNLVALQAQIKQELEKISTESEATTPEPDK